jgi:hypothetical protein
MIYIVADVMNLVRFFSYFWFSYFACEGKGLPARGFETTSE